MPQQTFENFIVSERERLNTEREAVFNQQKDLENKLTGINRELAAIDAYEAAKTGKQAAPARQPANSIEPVAPDSKRKPNSKQANPACVITK